MHRATLQPGKATKGGGGTATQSRWPQRESRIRIPRPTKTRDHRTDLRQVAGIPRAIIPPQQGALYTALTSVAAPAGSDVKC